MAPRTIGRSGAKRASRGSGSVGPHQGVPVPAALATGELPSKGNVLRSVAQGLEQWQSRVEGIGLSINTEKARNDAATVDLSGGVKRRPGNTGPNLAFNRAVEERYIGEVKNAMIAEIDSAKTTYANEPVKFSEHMQAWAKGAAKGASEIGAARVAPLAEAMIKAGASQLWDDAYKNNLAEEKVSVVQQQADGITALSQAYERFGKTGLPEDSETADNLRTHMENEVGFYTTGTDAPVTPGQGQAHLDEIKFQRAFALARGQITNESDAIEFVQKLDAGRYPKITSELDGTDRRRLASMFGDFEIAQRREAREAQTAADDFAREQKKQAELEYDMSIDAYKIGLGDSGTAFSLANSKYFSSQERERNTLEVVTTSLTHEFGNMSLDDAQAATDEARTHGVKAALPFQLALNKVRAEKMSNPKAYAFEVAQVEGFGDAIGPRVSMTLDEPESVEKAIDQVRALRERLNWDTKIPLMDNQDGQNLVSEFADLEARDPLALRDAVSLFVRDLDYADASAVIKSTYSDSDDGRTAAIMYMSRKGKKDFILADLKFDANKKMADPRWYGKNLYDDQSNKELQAEKWINLTGGLPVEEQLAWVRAARVQFAQLASNLPYKEDESSVVDLMNKAADGVMNRSGYDIGNGRIYPPKEYDGEAVEAAFARLFTDSRVRESMGGVIFLDHPDHNKGQMTPSEFVTNMQTDGIWQQIDDVGLQYRLWVMKNGYELVESSNGNPFIFDIEKLVDHGPAPVVPRDARGRELK